MKNLSSIIFIFLFFTFSCGNHGGVNDYKKSLKGHWELIDGKWHSGIMITKDSVFVLNQYDKIWRPIGGRSLGVPFRLTKEDSLIFGPPSKEVSNSFGLNSALIGYWQIIEVTPDSMAVKGSNGLLQFKRIERLIDLRFLE